MIRRLLAIAVMVYTIPATAFATTWTLNTQVTNAGGTMTSRNKTGQTSATPSIFKMYTTHNMAPISVSANAGFSISSVKINTTPVAGCAGASSCQTPNLTGAVGQTIVAVFAPAVYSESASVTQGGAVSPTSYSNVYYGTQSPGQVFTFTPKAGFALTSLTPTNATILCSTNLGTTYTSCSSSYGTGVTVKVKVTYVTGNVKLDGAFSGPPIANAGAPQTVYPNTTVVLHGSVTPSEGATYSWTVTGPATVALNNANTATPSFIPPVAGTYNCNLSVNGSAASASTTVTATNSVTATIRNVCANCHISAGVSPVAYTNWSTSAHKANLVVCATCHVGADTGGHPGATVTAATCGNCHSSTLSTTTHPIDITAGKCINCHDGHNPAQGIADLTPSSHPAVTLYTFEEIGMQMAGGAKVPVQVDANGKGMPYSPKQSCGTAGCHIKNGVDYTYDRISDHAFHSSQGRNEYQDSSTGKFDATKNKPWLQSTAMVGKW